MLLLKKKKKLTGTFVVWAPLIWTGEQQSVYLESVQNIQLMAMTNDVCVFSYVCMFTLTDFG